MYTQGMTGNIVNDDGTAYVNHNAVNMGDQPLVNGSKVLATITMKAKADIDLSDTDVIDLSTVTLMGPDFSVKESKVVNEVEIPDVPTTTTVEYGQDAFESITITNDAVTDIAEDGNVSITADEFTRVTPAGKTTVKIEDEARFRRILEDEFDIII